MGTTRTIRSCRSGVASRPAAGSRADAVPARGRGVNPRRPAAPACAALCCALLAGPAHAGERCRFTGETDHAGRVEALVDVSDAPGGERTVDVLLDVRATVWWVLDVRYLVEERSTWRAGVLREVAVNTRSLSGGRVVRQSWDDFRRDGDTLAARRVQARTLAQFRLRHPAFAAHWDPGAFGAPWLADYDAAAPERRPDLDLPAADPATRTPLATAFFWTRWLPEPTGTVPVVLPGFKRDATLPLDPVARAPGPDAPPGTARQWDVALRHPALDRAASSRAEAWVAADHRLLGLAFELHAPAGSARGTVRAEGCGEGKQG
ncbi:MAG: hypothetical protein ACRYG6_13030 [Janthinobacterium lividum]